MSLEITPVRTRKPGREKNMTAQVAANPLVTAKPFKREVRLYEPVTRGPNPDAGDKDFTDYLNPESPEVLKDCKLERSLESAAFPEPYQFLRLGYFCVDNKDSKPGTLVFNRSVSLKDRFKIQ